MHALKHCLVGLLALLLLPATSALAQTVDVKAVAEGLQAGGYVIVFRHGATNRDQADTDPLNPDDVSKQRLLSDTGREVARQIGLVFRTMQIPIDPV